MIDPPARIRRVLLESRATVDPLEAMAMAPGEPAFYWRSDDRDVEIAALGAVATVDADGPDRFPEAAARIDELRRAIDDEAPGFPLAVGGFAFDDARPRAPWTGLPSLRFFVPRVLWLRTGGERRIAVARPAGRGQTPAALLGCAQTGDPSTDRTWPAEDRESWRRRVESATAAIRAGSLGKVVLSRRQSVAVAGSLPVADLLRTLAEARPSCFTFLVRSGGRTFVGSSPERLVRRSLDGLVECDALAGSAPRAPGQARDDQHARELTASAKERREHRFVVDAIHDVLAGLCAVVEVPDHPSCMALPEAWHLRTAIRGRLAPGRAAAILDLAAALHPTPAVCGAPREAAFRRLAAEEGERGWYAGAVGWLGAEGDGELAVALRAALLDEGLAHVWAGAGVVDGSSADAEWDETERKMCSILPWLEAGEDERAA